MFILSVLLIAGCGGSGDSTAPVTISSVSLTTPADGATGVSINTKVTATFNEEMDPATITSATFLLYQGATAVPGTVDYTGLTAVFTPDSNLTASTTYTATITTGAKNLADEALASDYEWAFTTGTTSDATAPTATIIVPSNTETGVSINTAIAATFSEVMNPLTITTTTFTVTGPGVTPVSGMVTYSGQTAVFTPASNLAATTIYTATITIGAEDLAGNALAVDKVWTFTTGTTADTTAPTVTITNPADLATGVEVSKKVQATFSEPMDPTMINTATFTLKQGVTSVAGTVNYIGLVATFTPQSNLAANTTYTGTIITEVEDMAGNALASNKVWSFTTVTALSLGPVPVDLGTAENFVILSKSGISDAGAPVSAITGDIGVSPIDSTAITGFGLTLDASGEFSTSALVTGNVYASDYAVPTPANLTTAISDMETAYTDAAGRSLPDSTELGTGDISGMTLAPGLYKWSTGVTITAAGVTLTGGANDVWIFQIAGDITCAGAVTLAGGAQAKNIFWQVGGPAGVILNVGSVFQGNILAQKAVTMNSAVTLTGRVLAQTAVTLINNPITAP